MKSFLLFFNLKSRLRGRRRILAYRGQPISGARANFSSKFSSKKWVCHGLDFCQNKSVICPCLRLNLKNAFPEVMRKLCPYHLYGQFFLVIHEVGVNSLGWTKTIVSPPQKWKIPCIVTVNFTSLSTSGGGDKFFEDSYFFSNISLDWGFSGE